LHYASLLEDRSTSVNILWSRVMMRSQRRQELLTYGDAQRMAGDFDLALDTYDRVVGDSDEWPAAVAWRIGLLYFLRGDPGAALQALGRAGIGPTPPSTLDSTGTVDEMHAWATAAAASWMRGDRPAAVRRAAYARDLAVAIGEPRALAAGFTAVALCASLADDPDGTARHYALALAHAEAAGDLVQAARIRTNQVHHLLVEARYPAAAELAESVRGQAERAGEAAVLAIALCNEGEAAARVGRFDAAVSCFERALAMFQRMGSRRVGCALAGLGDVYRWRGERVRARASYEEAVRVARPDGDRQALVPGLAGLAWVLAPTEPGLGRRLAQEAVDRASGSSTAGAWCAYGWTALCDNDRPAAVEAADRAAATARRRREPASLADALELAAVAGDDRTLFTEAARIWADAGAPLFRDRVLLGRAALAHADADDRLAGRLARDRLAAAGVLVAGLTPVPPPDEPGVEVRVLGRFEVRVAGEAVPATAWRSRKARDLLRILVGRRGRAMPRDELAELLWPGARDPAHSLSVVLSIARGVLDPGRALPADHYVMATGSSLAVDLDRVRVDAEAFLADVAHGLRLRDRGSPDLARAMLGDAVARYAGDPFEDEPYDDWAAPLREEARDALARAVRALAELATVAGDHGEAARCHLLVLARDRYDEAAHRALVETLRRAGRHGEARRAYERYRAAMRDIDVEPSPWPAVS
jgi:DNA-binding SARP family transcriptional activator